MPAHLLEAPSLLLGPLFRKRPNYRRVYRHFGTERPRHLTRFRTFSTELFCSYKLTPYESEVPMESLRQEVKSFVDGCEHLLALGSAESLSAQEFERIDHYLLEVEKFVCDDEPELGMRGVDAA